MKNTYLKIFIIIICFCTFSLISSAQFRDKAFKQNYADTTIRGQADTTSKLFSFKQYFRALGHKQEIGGGKLFAGSMFFIGGMQIYNKHYWKLPIVYSGIGTGVGLGIYYHKKKPTLSKLMYAGAGLFYWASLMDGVICLKTEKKHSPAKATLFAILVPGLGQAYNKEYWKIPIYVGGLVGTAHFWHLNHQNYKRYQKIYIDASKKDYNGPISAENALYYRKQYRRMRDYSILGFAAVYLLQIIDANVFAYMLDFDVNDDLSLKVEPTIICPNNQYALRTGESPTAVGVKLGFSF